MGDNPPIRFNNSYAAINEAFARHQLPAGAPAPELVELNSELAEYLNINSEWLASEEGLAMLAGNQMPSGAEPVATVYAGHQFGNYNPQLGDGRALLLGEVIARDGRRYDLQLKGSGRTPYSRGGDGKSPLGPVVREYIVSEAMHRLGVPSTRALAAVATGEQVLRDTGPLAGGILCRVASSHLRIGTVQYFAAQRNIDALRALVDHVIQRHYPECTQSEQPYLDVFDQILRAQADLVSRWQALGFIHGVMNTDNMLLCGETIDYGPCAFMEEYHPGTVFSSIDQQGRYAFGNQPAIAHWNLAQLAQAMLPLFAKPGEEDLKPAVERVQPRFDAFNEVMTAAYRRRMAEKLGLSTCGHDDDQLYRDFLDLLATHQCDFTQSFRRLCDLAGEALPDQQRNADIADIFEFSEAFAPWLARWRDRLATDTLGDEQRYQQMCRANPVYIPRNHLVEAVIQAAYNGDLQPFHRLHQVLRAPFSYRPRDRDYALSAQPGEQVTATFCGT